MIFQRATSLSRKLLRLTSLLEEAVPRSLLEDVAVEHSEEAGCNKEEVATRSLSEVEVVPKTTTLSRISRIKMVAGLLWDAITVVVVVVVVFNKMVLLLVVAEVVVRVKVVVFNKVVGVAFKIFNKVVVVVGFKIFNKVVNNASLCAAPTLAWEAAVEELEVVVELEAAAVEELEVVAEAEHSS